MPWRVRYMPIKGSEKDYAIQKEEPEGSGRWKIVGRSTSKGDAEASVRARAAGAHD